MAATTLSDHHPLRLDSIPTVDLRLLSQSELHSLSLCSDSAFDLRRCDDVIIPKIDRSVFNESAGSRKQTYSRLRLAPASTATIHRRTPHLRSHIPTSNSISSVNDPEQAENSQIISLLKDLFKSDPNYSDLVPIEVEYSFPVPAPGPPEIANPVTIVGKRKRGRPRKGEKVLPPEAKAKGTTANNVVKKAVVFSEVDDNRDKEIVNCKGVIVDIVKLAELEDPYGPEITRRTVGMSTEDQLLGFLNGLNGVWGSRRKKKRVVDAGDFGDALPKGWRLSLSIKKKVGQVWLFCRRYMSPSGRQFASCRDISAYLLSILGPENLNNPNCTYISNDNEHASNVASGNDLQVNCNGSILAEESSDNPVKSCIASGDKVCGMEKFPDVVLIKSDIGVACETSLSNNDNNSRGRPSGETPVIDFVDNRAEKYSLEQEVFGSCVISPIPNEQTSGGVDKLVIAESVDAEVINEEAVSEIGFFPSNTSGTMDHTEIPDDKDFPGIFGESNLDTDAKGDSLSNFCKTPAGLGEDGASNVKQDSSSECHSLVPHGSEELFQKENGIIPSMIIESELKTSPVSNILIPSGDGDSHGIDMNSNTPASSIPYSFNPSGNEQTFDLENVTRLEGEKNYESCEPSCCIENNVAEISIGEMEESKVNEFQAFETNEPVVPMDDGDESGQNPSVMAIAKEKNLEFCSLIPSGNEQTFDLEDDVTGIYDSAMEDCKDGISERGLLNHFCIAETSDNVFGDKLYNSPLDELKFDEGRDIGNHQLSLAFGNPHGGLYAGTTSVEQKRDLVSRSFVPSDIDQSFGVQTNLSMVNSSMEQDFKEGRDSMSDLFSLSCNSGTNNFGNNLSTVYTGREWDGTKMDVVGNSINKNYMAGYGTSPYQPAQHVMPSAMWRTGEGNALQSRLAGPLHPSVQPPSSFRTFDIISDKAEDGLFRLGGNYNNGPGVNGFRSGRSEPVEFSFLTAHNSNSFQENSKVFSYGMETGQGFNHPFWLGKDVMIPNTSVNQVTAVCVWCRNEFQHDPSHSGIQAGIGSMCPTCSARISQQVNIL